MNEERRLSPRIRAYRPVRLQRPNSHEPIQTLTKDIGGNGLRCVISDVVPVSTELSVELILSDGEQPLVTRGQAMWFRMLPHSDQFDLGISFIDQSPQNKRRLSVYLERLSSKLSSDPTK